MFYLMDNFEIYDAVRTSGNMDLDWLSRVFTVKQTTPNNLIVGTFEDRVGLGTRVNTTGQRSVYLPLGTYLQNDTRINITQRLLALKTGGAAIGGLSLVSDTQDDHILSFGFYSAEMGFVRYVGEDDLVREDTFLLPTALSLSHDIIEWSFEKTDNDSQVYRPFSLWVNNRPAYIGEVFCQVGSAGSLAARIVGATSVANVGLSRPSKFINSGTNVTIPAMGVTDLVVTDGERVGLVRVEARAGVADIGPNSFVSNVVADSHAEVVGKIPPNEDEYLMAVSADSEEMYAALAFPDLASESVLAVSLQVVGQKNSPFAMDLDAMMQYQGNKMKVGDLNVNLRPGFSNLILERNPWTGLRWTPLEANAVNFGVRTS